MNFKRMFKILGAKNRRKNLHKHPGPHFQIREGPGSFSNAQKFAKFFVGILVQTMTPKGHFEKIN